MFISAKAFEQLKKTAEVEARVAAMEESHNELADLVYAVAAAMGVSIAEGPIVMKTSVLEEVSRRGGVVFGFNPGEPNGQSADGEL